MFGFKISNSKRPSLAGIEHALNIPIADEKHMPFNLVIFFLTLLIIFSITLGQRSVSASNYGSQQLF